MTGAAVVFARPMNPQPQADPTPSNGRPAAEGIQPGQYPGSPVSTNHTAPSPRRVRAVLGGHTVLDTTTATYVWEHPYYPQYYIPAADVRAEFLVADDHEEDTPRGRVQRRSLVVGEHRRPGAALFLPQSTVRGLDATYRFEWSAMDAWFEEDEQVHVHPRSPYVRVDALRTSRHVRVEKDGVLLAEADSAVALLETGLPPRYYLDRSAVHWEHLRATATRTSCPYKGTTGDYWSVVTPTGLHEDLAWGYAFTTREAQPVAGMVAFYNEHVDITLDGQAI